MGLRLAGLQRVLGVVVGVLVAYGFARLAGINAWSIALVIFVSLLAGRALRLGQQGSIQVPVSALLVLVLGATTGGYALDRVVDTVIGAAAGSSSTSSSCRPPGSKTPGRRWGTSAAPWPTCCARWPTTWGRRTVSCRPI